MKKSEALQILAHHVSLCTKCPELVELRTQCNYFTVPGEGNPNADLMIIGEAPGEDEAKQGRPFVGRAGRLLDKIIESANWRRDQIFICNILKCRPPGNRVPAPEEAKNCRKFLDMQIRCIDPQWILCLGKTASIYLLNKPDDRSMASLRGEHEYNGKKVICTYHPSYLLRTPSAKADVWEDIKPIREALQPAKAS